MGPGVDGADVERVAGADVAAGADVERVSIFSFLMCAKIKIDLKYAILNGYF